MSRRKKAAPPRSKEIPKQAKKAKQKKQEKQTKQETQANQLATVRQPMKRKLKVPMTEEREQAIEETKENQEVHAEEETQLAKGTQEKQVVRRRRKKQATKAMQEKLEANPEQQATKATKTKQDNQEMHAAHEAQAAQERQKVQEEQKMRDKQAEYQRNVSLWDDPGFRFEQYPSDDDPCSLLQQTTRFTLSGNAYLVGNSTSKPRIRFRVKCLCVMNNVAAMFQTMLFYRSFYNTPGFFGVVSNDTLCCDPASIDYIQEKYISARKLFLRDSQETPTMAARLVDEWISVMELADPCSGVRLLTRSEKTAWKFLQAEWGHRVRWGCLFKLGQLDGTAELPEAIGNDRINPCLPNE